MIRPTTPPATIPIIAVVDSELVEDSADVELVGGGGEVRIRAGGGGDVEPAGVGREGTSPGGIELALNAAPFHMLATWHCQAFST